MFQWFFELCVNGNRTHKHLTFCGKSLSLLQNGDHLNDWDMTPYTLTKCDHIETITLSQQKASRFRPFAAQHPPYWMNATNFAASEAYFCIVLIK